MGKNYAAARFRSILLVSTFSLIVEYIVLLSHSIIVGRMLGTQALAALGIVTPLFSFIVFVACLISNGTVVLSNFAIGRQDRDEANRFFSQGIILSAGVGLTLTLCLLLFRQGIFSWFNVSSEIIGYVGEYYSIFLFLPVFQMFSTLLYMIVINEGGEKICAASSAVQIISSVGLAVVLCGRIGIAGCAVAFLASNFLSALILCSHFLNKRCQLRLMWHVKIKSVLSVLRYGAGDSVSFLYMTVFVMLMNVILSMRFGDEAIVIFSVLINFQTLMVTGLDGVGEAIGPLVSVYYGENNLHGIKKTMREAFVFAMAESVVVMALILIFAPHIPVAFGITDAGIAGQAVFALRVYSLSAVFWGFLMLLITYYMYTAKLALCHIMSPLLLFICPTLLCVMMPARLGLGANWVAMAVSVIPAMALSLLLIKRKSRGKVFPLLLDKDELDRQWSCDAIASAEGVEGIMDKAEEAMRRRGCDEKVVYRVRLVIEEVSMLTVEKSGGKRFYIECTLIFGERITLILRNGGIYTDLTESVAPDSVDTVPMEEIWRRKIVSAQKSKRFSLSGGDNRTVFHF